MLELHPRNITAKFHQDWLSQFRRRCFKSCGQMDRGTDGQTDRQMDAAQQLITIPHLRTLCSSELIRFHLSTNWISTVQRILSLYLTSVKFPPTTTNCNFKQCEIPPQTITEPLLILSVSIAQTSMKHSREIFFFT